MKKMNALKDDSRRANEIMQELKSGCFTHFDELYLFSKDKIETLARLKGFSFTDPMYGLDDLGDEVMEKVFHSRNIFDASKASYGTWLETIATNKYRNMYKKMMKKSMGEIEKTMGSENEVDTFDLIPGHRSAENEYLYEEAQYAYEEAVEKLYTHFDSLPENQKTVAKLCLVGGEKPGKLAKSMGVDAQNVYNWVNRVKKYLRNCAEQEGLNEVLLEQDDLEIAA
ncbi:MAG: sigma-70 family RNA polymerase sigma factor [Lachnospiraceae bacterium]|nr:sigma-70 family RNA polymerase sigma factor [Lachnospiraceae bacterium]